MHETAGNPPDRAAMEKDLKCPLCGYNLRGLTEPRCPECGFRFAWQELIEADRKRHPFLFEYGKGRNIRTFLRTFWRTSLPRRFWRDVSPALDVKVGRLALYCVFSYSICFFLLACVCTPYPETSVHVLTTNFKIRSDYKLVTERPGYLTAVSAAGSHMYLTTRQLNQRAPLPWQADFWQEVLSVQRLSYLDSWQREHFALLACGWSVLFIAWPILTLGSLVIFRASMRQAKIKTVHLLRAAIYSCDFGLLLVCAAFAFQFIDIQYHEGGYLVAMSGVFALIVTYRLTIAFKKYLRAHLPFATVVASQIIVFLIVFLALAQVADFTRQI